MLEITWFTNEHEYRNHFFRFGLEQLARQGRVRLRRWPVEQGESEGLPSAFATNAWRHASVLQVRNASGRRLRVFIDNEDGFVHLNPLIEQVDLYFCVPYASAFHEGKEFITPYAWQSEADVAEYRAKAKQLIARFGHHFSKVRRLCPTPTDLASPPHRRSAARQKLANARHKIEIACRSWLGLGHPASEVEGWQRRWDQIIGYRHGPLGVDVVSRESLWGWPAHRVRLHAHLRTLRDRYNILHQLSPVPETGAGSQLLDQLPPEERSLYPELIRPLALPVGETFESAISHSRLAIFPTGFHWGWRGITFLCLAAGGPILMDRPVYEPYFDFEEFQVFYNDNSWADVEDLLKSINEPRWVAIRKHNQATFDKYLTPAAAGEYLLTSIEREISKR